MIETLQQLMQEQTQMTAIEHLCYYRDVFLNVMFPPLETKTEASSSFFDYDLPNKSVIEDYSPITKTKLAFVSDVRAKLRLHTFFTEEAAKIYYNGIFSNPIVRDMMFEYALMLKMYLIDKKVYDEVLSTLSKTTCLLNYEQASEFKEGNDCYDHSPLPFELYNEVTVDGQQVILKRLKADPLALAGLSLLIIME